VRTWATLVVLAAVLAACARDGGSDQPPAGQAFEFGVIGDFPYTPEELRKFDRLVDGLGRTPEGDAEHPARAVATQAWLQAGFEAEATGSRGVVVFIQANPVDPGRPELFAFSPETVAADVVDHGTPR
jgi:hypothetical protein